MKGRLLFFSFLSILLESMFVSADAFSGSSFFGGTNPLRLNIKFGTLANPTVWAVLSCVALIGFVLFIAAMKIPFFEGNKTWAGIFAALLAIISIFTTPVVVWVMAIGMVGGVIVSLFGVFAILYSMTVVFRGVKKDANIERRDKKLEDVQSKIEHEGEKERLEDRGRYKRTIRLLKGAEGDINGIKTPPSGATGAVVTAFQDECDRMSRTLDTIRVRLTGDMTGDGSGDGVEAEDYVRKAIDALDNGEKSTAKKFVKKAWKVLKKHKLP